MADTTVATVETVLERANYGFTEEFIKGKVRFDPISNMFSVIDAIKLVCGVDVKIATQHLSRILKDDDSLADKMERHRFPRQRGRNDTPIATFATVCEVISSINTKKAKEFRRTAMKVLARALGGDLQLARIIEAANALFAGTPLQEALLEGTGAVAEGPGALVPSEGFGPGALVVLTREDSNRVAEARIAAAFSTAHEEMQMKMREERLQSLERYAAHAKDVAGPGVSPWYAAEVKGKARLELAKAEELVKCMLPPRRPVTRKRKISAAEEAGGNPEPSCDWVPDTATPEQVEYWVRHEDGAYCFPTKAAEREYVRLVSYPFDLSMNVAAMQCAGRTLPCEEDE